MPSTSSSGSPPPVNLEGFREYVAPDLDMNEWERHLLPTEDEDIVITGRRVVIKVLFEEQGKFLKT